MSVKTPEAMIFSGNFLVADEANPSANLGQLMATDDGRAFRYILAGTTALVAGQLQQAAAQDTGDQNITPTAAAIGDSSVVTSSTMTVTANQYAHGQMMVTITPGVGISYGIKSHAAYTAAAATFYLTDNIRVALTTTSRVDFIVSPYSGLVVFPTTMTGIPVGVATTAITASQYGWVQVEGVGCVLADGAVTVGQYVVASNGVAGAVEPLQGTTLGVQPLVGVAMAGIANTDYGAVKITLR